jgi:hypothetical protein
LDPGDATEPAEIIDAMRVVDLTVAERRPAIAPWFRDRPGMASAVATAMFAAGSIIGATWPDQQSLTLVLLTLPVALMAVTLGRAGGLAAGLVGVGLAGIWSLSSVGADVGASGWAAACALLVLGGLLGGAVDALETSDRRAVEAEEERAALEANARRHAEAIEINDLMVQSVAVAKWSLESGNQERALEILDEIGEAGQRLVSQLLRDTPAPPRRLPQR